MFFKKKDINEVVLMHYEGLIGFKQDFPCKAFIEDENVLFKNDTTDIRLYLKTNLHTTISHLSLTQRELLVCV